MTAGHQIFAIALIVGLLFLGAEIFIPGGVLGTVGGVALLIAVVLGFVVFPPQYGFFITIGILTLTGVAVYLWIKFFPDSRLGRKMTVKYNLATYKGTQDGLGQLVGKEGETLSALHPGGFALIDNQRVDVVTQGEMIEKGVRVRVVDVEGNRVVVRRAESEA